MDNKSPQSPLSRRIDQWLLNRLYSRIGRPRIRIRLENSAQVPAKDSLPVATIVIRDRKSLLGILLEPQLGFGEGYTTGQVEVEGNLVTALEEVFRAMPANAPYAQMAARFLSFVQPNSPSGARRNVHHHYDRDTEFFGLWLDSNLEYSGGYFASPFVTLDAAQIAKMEHICRKLNLQPGERVVDIGCGWGALAMYMAKHYGVLVRAISNSHEQILWARHHAAERQLPAKVEFIEDDYRNFRGRSDAVVSVGMLEHVGAGHYGEMGGVLNRILGPAGRGLIQTIGRNQQRPFNPWTLKRIFPGAYAPTLRKMMDIFEPYDFAVADLENLRAHYALTLEHWLERFESAKEQISQKFGPEFVRLWRLYLAGSMAGFRSGSLQLFQVLFARKDCPFIPLTRAHLYQPALLEKSEEDWIFAVR